VAMQPPKVNVFFCFLFFGFEYFAILYKLIISGVGNRNFGSESEPNLGFSNNQTIMQNVETAHHY